MAAADSVLRWTDGACKLVNASGTGWSQDCCVGGQFQQADLPRNFGICVAWLLILCWIFLGVAMGADVFMTSIETITSAEYTKKIKTKSGKEKVFHVRVWNDTVANLTLMALGSSAPEILLNVLEIILEDFYAGALGPSTIVGSAAFNLMVITAVCVAALPAGESRTIKQLGVFAVTSTFSVIAYLWLLLIVIGPTKKSANVIELWEALTTIGLLVLLLTLAYIADKRGSGQMKLGLFGRSTPDAETYALARSNGIQLLDASGKPLSPEALAKELQSYVPPKTRAHYRHAALQGLPGHAYVGSEPPPRRLQRSATFQSRGADPEQGLGAASSVKQQLQHITPAVEDGGPPLAARITSTGSSGRAGSPGNLKKSNSSNDVHAATAAPRHTRMPIPSAGMIRWVQERVSVAESGKQVRLLVERVGGVEGSVSVAYTTKDQQARAGMDYSEAKGSVTFGPGDATAKDITIGIHDDDELEKDETFTVVLSDPTGGAIFDSETDGGHVEAICTVTIVNDDDRATAFATAMQILRMDMDQLKLSQANWGSQVRSAFTLPEERKPFAMLMFVLWLPWRLLFSLVPPPNLGGGWPCFWGALIGIGIQVILVSDFAGQMGCQMYLPPSITAITFVALGTSLPDLLASKQAAIELKTADASIGNVTGSNSVNVFFGLGLPWLIGAVVWRIQGATDAWKARYAHLPDVIANWPDGAFVVESGDLAFSVIIFSICAILTIITIYLRRPTELGGRVVSKWVTFSFFVFLWLFYVLMSVLSSIGVIPSLT